VALVGRPVYLRLRELVLASCKIAIDETVVAFGPQGVIVAAVDRAQKKRRSAIIGVIISVALCANSEVYRQKLASACSGPRTSS
jgi:hypothetical protein